MRSIWYQVTQKVTVNFSGELAKNWQWTFLLESNTSPTLSTLLYASFLLTTRWSYISFSNFMLWPNDRLVSRTALLTILTRRKIAIVDFHYGYSVGLSITWINSSLKSSQAKCISSAEFCCERLNHSGQGLEKSNQQN